MEVECHFLNVCLNQHTSLIFLYIPALLLTRIFSIFLGALLQKIRLFYYSYLMLSNLSNLAINSVSRYSGYQKRAKKKPKLIYSQTRGKKLQEMLY